LFPHGNWELVNPCCRGPPSTSGELAAEKIRARTPGKRGTDAYTQRSILVGHDQGMGKIFFLSGKFIGKYASHPPGPRRGRQFKNPAACVFKNRSGLARPCQIFVVTLF